MGQSGFGSYFLYRFCYDVDKLRFHRKSRLYYVKLSFLVATVVLITFAVVKIQSRKYHLPISDFYNCSANFDSLWEKPTFQVPIPLINKQTKDFFKGEFSVISALTVEINSYSGELRLKLRSIAQKSQRSFIYENQYFSIVNQYKSELTENRTALDSDSFVFVILGVAKAAKRSKTVANTWLRGSRFNYIFGDEFVPDIPNFITLNCLLGKHTLENANRRQIEGMLWMRDKRPELANKEWLIIADDDTWMNLPAMSDYLSQFDHNLPLAVGMIFDDTWEKGIAYHQGGAGIAISRAAVNLLNLYMDRPEICGKHWWVDVFIGLCFTKLGILKINTDKIFWDPPPLLFINGEFRLDPTLFVNKISFHHMTSYRIQLLMTCEVALAWNQTLADICDNHIPLSRSHYHLSYKRGVEPIFA